MVRETPSWIHCVKTPLRMIRGFFVALKAVLVIDENPYVYLNKFEPALGTFSLKAGSSFHYFLLQRCLINRPPMVRATAALPIILTGLCLNSAFQPLSLIIFGIVPFLKSSMMPSQTFTRSARMSGIQWRYLSSLCLKAYLRMAPLSPDGGTEVPNTTLGFGRSLDFRSSIVIGCCSAFS